MKKIAFIILLLILVSSLFSVCKKENEYPFSFLYFQRFDPPLTGGFSPKPEFDVDGDSIPDLKLFGDYWISTVVFGPHTYHFDNYSSEIAVSNSGSDFEVSYGLYDTETKYLDYDERHVKYKLNDIIDSNSLWTKSINFKYQTHNGFYGVWRTQNEGYIGIRKKVLNHYRYGWMKLRAEYSTYIVYEIAFDTTNFKEIERIKIGRLNY